MPERSTLLKYSWFYGMGKCFLAHYLCKCTRLHRSYPSYQQRLVRDLGAELNVAISLALDVMEGLPFSRGRGLTKNVGLPSQLDAALAVGGLLVPIKVARCGLQDKMWNLRKQSSNLRVA